MLCLHHPSRFNTFFLSGYHSNSIYKILLKQKTKKGKERKKKEREKEKKKARLRKVQYKNEDDIDPEVTGDTKGMLTVYKAHCGGQGCQPPISPYSDFLQSAAEEDHNQVRTPASPRMV